MARKKVKPATLEELLAEQGSVSSGELAAALGLSRQAAHARLRGEVLAGRLRRVGEGRGARYAVAATSFLYPVAISAEDRIVKDLASRVPGLAALEPATESAFSSAAGEMLNNALEHSGGTTVSVRVRVSATAVELEVEDDGVGAFFRVKEARDLASFVEAAAELTKGRVTSMPERHSGEGIFFTSRVAERFELSANGHALVVSAVLDDVAVLSVPPRVGTLVSLRLARPPRRTLRELFDAHTIDFEFVRTKTVVRLFGLGADFLSRSEAKRLLLGLERFHEVELDFNGVPGVGQAFADEVFRVWAKAHPTVTLTPTRMNEDVAFFVARARRAAGASDTHGLPE